MTAALLAGFVPFGAACNKWVPPSDINVVFVGDSIARGTYRAAEESYTSFAKRAITGLPATFPNINWTISNKGVDSANTTTAATIGWRTLFPSVVPPLAPHLTIIMLGTNDAGADIGRESYKANLRILIDSALALGSYVIVMVHPPVNNANPQTYSYTDTRAALYAQDCRDVAAEYNTVEVLDVYALVDAHRATDFANQFFVYDGVHLSDQSHQEVYNALVPVIQSVLGI